MAPTSDWSADTPRSPALLGRQQPPQRHLHPPTLFCCRVEPDAGRKSGGVDVAHHPCSSERPGVWPPAEAAARWRSICRSRHSEAVANTQTGGRRLSPAPMPWKPHTG